MSWFLLNRNLTLLEPYDWKLSCTVLRGERGSNAPDLPGRGHVGLDAVLVVAGGIADGHVRVEQP